MTMTTEGEDADVPEGPDNHSVAYAIRLTDLEDIDRVRNAHTPRMLNEPLRDAMFRAGFQWKDNGCFAHFVDIDGNYVPYPPGYIRGPHFSGNGNPRPLSYSVQSRDGWRQRSFDQHSTEAAEWAMKTARDILLAPIIEEENE